MRKKLPSIPTPGRMAFYAAKTKGIGLFYLAVEFLQRDGGKEGSLLLGEVQMHPSLFKEVLEN